MGGCFPLRGGGDAVGQRWDGIGYGVWKILGGGACILSEEGIKSGRLELGGM